MTNKRQNIAKHDKKRQKFKKFFAGRTLIVFVLCISFFPFLSLCLDLDFFPFFRSFFLSFFVFFEHFSIFSFSHFFMFLLRSSFGWGCVLHLFCWVVLLGLLLLLGGVAFLLFLLRGAAWSPPSLALFSSPFTWCCLVLFPLWVVSPVWW